MRSRRHPASNGGSVSIYFAIVLTMLLGFVGLATDVGYALFKQRQMQAVASAAAVSAANAAMVETGVAGTAAQIKAAALADAKGAAAAAGYVNGAASVVVTVNNPPLSGAYASTANAYEVIVSQPQTLPLVAFVTGNSSAWTVNARAVAIAGAGGGFCVLQLDPSNHTGLSMSNGVNLTLNQCGLAVDATGSSALSVTGGSILTAASVSVSGLTNVSNGGAINSTTAVKTSQPAVTDKYAGTPVPVASGCITTSSYNTTTTLSQGTYCNGLIMGGGATITMSSGIYIISGGSFSVGGGATAQSIGNGVTIVLTGSGANYATATISNGAAATLTALASGPTSGLLFFQDPAAPKSGTNTFQGTASSLILIGCLYFPSQTVAFANGASTNSTCTQLVAYNITMNGGAAFNSNCGFAGTQNIGSSPSRLAE